VAWRYPSRHRGGVREEEISRTCDAGKLRCSVHLYPPSRRVEIFELPTSQDGFERMATPLAVGVVRGTSVDWEVNSLGAEADHAAAWTLDYVNEADRLLFFVDETGGESLSDPSYPVFGLGGCLVRAEDYVERVGGPWRTMKRRHFGGFDAPMHATELRPTPEQLGAMAEFFSTGTFFRVAAVVKKSTRIGAGIGSVYQAAGTMLLRNLAAVLRRADCSGVTTVFESSDRGDRLAKRFFPAARAHAEGKEIPLRWRTMVKAAGEPGLEVADFVMHAAGNQVRSHEQGRHRYRKDFICVFQNVDASLVEFSEVSTIELAHNPAGTINAVLIDPTSEVVGKSSK